MKFQQLKSLFTIFLIAISAFAINKLILYCFGLLIVEHNFQYSIVSLYLCFMFATLAIILLLQKMAQKTIDHVGYAFMGLTLFKMGICYVFLKPILNSSSKYISCEKINFFVIFILFLIIETLFTIRILNNKQ